MVYFFTRKIYFLYYIRVRHRSPRSHRCAAAAAAAANNFYKKCIPAFLSLRLTSTIFLPTICCFRENYVKISSLRRPQDKVNLNQNNFKIHCTEILNSRAGRAQRNIDSLVYYMRESHRSPHRCRHSRCRRCRRCQKSRPHTIC